MELSSDTTNLLRPHQVTEAREELSNLTATLNAPPHIRGRISDPREMRRRRDNLAKELEANTPKPFATNERDAAIREFSTLADKIRQGMPSSEEMRRNPPGAVGKQLAWNKAQSENVMRYKHVALRLHAGGDLPPDMKFEGDIANIERLRPLTTVNQLAMDGAQIPKTTDFHFGKDIAGAVAFSDEETTALKLLSPELAGQLAVLSNEARQGIKEILAKAMGGEAKVDVDPPDPAVKPAKPELRDMNYNTMKSMAAKAGIATKGITKNDLITKLRDRHLIA